MCVDPGTIFAVASTATQAIGGLRGGSAGNAAAEANADALEREAQIERNAGQFNVARERRDLRRQLAQQRAAAGSQGTALTGQPVSILADSARQAESDLQAIRFDSEARATSFETQADFRRFEGRRRRDAGFLRAGTSLLTGASRIAGSFM